jgi:hypothetical protein
VDKHKCLLAHLASRGVEDNKPIQDAEDINTSATNDAHACLCKAYVEDQERKAAATKNLGGAIPPHQLQPGLQITLAACNKHELGSVNVILWKQD